MVASLDIGGLRGKGFRVRNAECGVRNEEQQAPTHPLATHLWWAGACRPTPTTPSARCPVGARSWSHPTNDTGVHNRAERTWWGKEVVHRFRAIGRRRRLQAAWPQGVGSGELFCRAAKVWTSLVQLRRTK